MIFAIPVAVRRVRLTRPNRAKVLDSRPIGSRRIRILGTATRYLMALCHTPEEVDKETLGAHN